MTTALAVALIVSLILNAALFSAGLTFKFRAEDAEAALESRES